VELNQAELKAATDFLEADGFSAFTLDLLSGLDETDPVSEHSVRLIDNYSVSAMGYNLYKVEMVLEGMPEEPCLWCGVEAAWDAEESAWDTTVVADTELTAIRPLAISGVEWWKDPRPSTLTISFKYGVNFEPECTTLVFELETLLSPFPDGSTASVEYFDLVPPSIAMTPVSNTGFTADLSEWLGGDVFANFTVDFNGGTWQPAAGEGFRATLTAYDQNDNVMWDHSEELYTNFPGEPPEPAYATGGYLATSAECSGAEFGGGY
jgi:hypothetical protein